jgi:hypothetical protein
MTRRPLSRHAASQPGASRHADDTDSCSSV